MLTALQPGRAQQAVWSHARQSCGGRSCLSRRLYRTRERDPQFRPVLGKRCSHPQYSCIDTSGIRCRVLEGPARRSASSPRSCSRPTRRPQRSHTILLSTSEFPFLASAFPPSPPRRLPRFATRPLHVGDWSLTRDLPHPQHRRRERSRARLPQMAELRPLSGGV